MILEYTAMVRRGWPNEGAIDRAENTKVGVTLSNGDWVSKQNDAFASVDKAVTATANMVGLVISGNGDTAVTTTNGFVSGNSCAVTGKSVVLWSGFVVETSNFVAGAWAPGSPVTIKTANPGVPTIGIVGTDPILGFVTNVTAALAGVNTASITILVK